MILERDTVVKGRQSSLGGGPLWFWGQDRIVLKVGHSDSGGKHGGLGGGTQWFWGRGNNCSERGTLGFRRRDQ